jgi:hypothetical protein
MSLRIRFRFDGRSSLHLRYDPARIPLQRMNRSRGNIRVNALARLR